MPVIDYTYGGDPYGAAPYGGVITTFDPASPTPTDGGDVPFPAGVQTFTARYRARDIIGDGSKARALVTVECETPLVHAPTGTLITTLRKSKWTSGGDVDFLLPVPGQPGMTAGFTGLPITSWGYKFSAQPTSSGQIIPGSTTFPDFGSVAPDSVVFVANYVNIGTWPHAVIVVSPGNPTPGGPVNNVIFVADPDVADRGLFYATDDGSYL